MLMMDGDARMDTPPAGAPPENEKINLKEPPIYTKALIATAIQIFFISLMISYFDIHVQDGVTNAMRTGLEVVGILSPYEESKKRAKKHYAQKEDYTDVAGLKVLTTAELSKYKGGKNSKGLYLALLGKVYDVSKGEKHYGPGGAYNFFVGRDASRAFVTGEFTETGLKDDVSGLSPQEYLGLEEWSQFYGNDYDLVGYVKGTYYDSSGRPTAKLKAYRASLTAAKQWRQEQQNENQLYPACNSEWTQNRGGRVWCTTKSGGVSRDWVGVPRKLYQPGSKTYRCACVRTTGPPSDGGKGNRGDLDNPNLKLYKSCLHQSQADSCRIEENEDGDKDE